MKLLPYFVLALFITACSTTQPEVVSHSVDTRGSIAFEAKANDDVDIYLDGKFIGQAEDFLVNEKQLKVNQGSHKIVVIDGDDVIYQEKIFIGNGVNKVIVLN